MAALGACPYSGGDQAPGEAGVEVNELVGTLTITGWFSFSAAEYRWIDAHGGSGELVLQASLCLLWEKHCGDVCPRRSGREQG